MYKYKTVIADDEGISRSSMQQIVDSCCPETEICGIFQNGNDAYEYIKNNPVDIAILDIRMPGMTGLEIAKAMKEQNRNIKFIIITGYRDFEYAYTAVNLQILAFILKPVDFSELIDMINKAILEFKTNNKAIYDKTKSLFYIRDSIRHSLANYVMLGMSSDELFNDKYFADNPLSERCCALIYFINDGEGFTDDVTASCWKDICEIQNENMDAFVLREDKKDAVILLLINNCEAGNITDFSTDFAENIVKLLKKAYEITTLYKLYPYNNIKLLRFGNLYEYAEKLQESVEHSKLYQQNEIMSHLESCRNTEIVKFFTEIYFKKIQALYPGALSESAFILDEEDCDFEDYIKIIELINNELNGSLKNNYVIHDIKNYVENSEKFDYSLKSVADHFGFSYAYFCRMFKQKTGQNFAEYMLNVRMQKAEELLKLNKYTVTEIANMVGFLDHKHFRKVFKGRTGLLPSEFVLAENFKNES